MVTNSAEDEQQIRSILQQYAKALNAADTQAVMQCYAQDGVLMAQNFPSSVGADAVRKAYDGIFAAIRLTVSFDILEVQQTGPEWAFARTHSAGQVLVHSNGATSAEGNQELFMMQKVQGQWKIARYCFSSTNPAHA